MFLKHDVYVGQAESDSSCFIYILSLLKTWSSDGSLIWPHHRAAGAVSVILLVLHCFAGRQPFQSGGKVHQSMLNLLYVFLP